MYRLLTTLLLTLAALVLLAWPLSRIGLACTFDRAPDRSSLLLAGRSIIVRSETVAPPMPLDRNRFTITADAAAATPPLPRLFSWTTTPTGLTVVVPLPPLLLIFGGAAFLLVLAQWLRARARLRRRRCPHCSYPRASAEGPCNECGLLLPEATLKSRPQVGRLIRDTAAVTFLAILTLCLGALFVVRTDERSAAVHSAKAFDYSWYLERTQPHLTGAVMFAAPGAGPGTLWTVVKSAQPGTTIVALPGQHQLGEYANAGTEAALDNLWLLGCGSETTFVTPYITKVNALRIQGISIRCDDNPFCYMRSGGSLHLRDCRVGGYNSGAGGSNSVFAVNAALLVDSCEFEGKTGRAMSAMRGNAFDLRDENHIFLRNTRFVDNQEVFRSAQGVIDGCKATCDTPMYSSPPGGPLVLTRNSEFPNMNRAAKSLVKFTEALDDPAILNQLAAGTSISRTFTDPTVLETAKTLNVGDEAFWRRLLIHPSAEVRALTSSKVQWPATAAAPTVTLEVALTKLDQAVIPAEVVVAILSDGENARSQLVALSGTGSQYQQGNAAALLHLMTVEPPFLELLRYEQLRTPK